LFARNSVPTSGPGDRPRAQGALQQVDRSGVRRAIRRDARSRRRCHPGISPGTGDPLGHGGLRFHG
jgi:hypothetical protein